MTMKTLMALWLSLAAASVTAAQTNFPPPKSVGAPAILGRNIQRTMTLLATSTPQKRNTVKVLFYGQSITEQEWARTVAEDLRRRFPNPNLIIENRAIGGHSSQLLVRTAEADLYPFYPENTPRRSRETPPRRSPRCGSIAPQALFPTALLNRASPPAW